VTERKDGLISSPGLSVVAESSRRCREAGLKTRLVLVSTTEEEVGMRGAGTAAFSLRPEGSIAADVTKASDDPGTRAEMVPCLLGKGPVIPSGSCTSPVVSRMHVEYALRRDLPHQRAPDGELAEDDQGDAGSGRGCRQYRQLQLGHANIK